MPLTILQRSTDLGQAGEKVADRGAEVGREEPAAAERVAVAGDPVEQPFDQPTAAARPARHVAATRQRRRPGQWKAEPVAAEPLGLAAAQRLALLSPTRVAEDLEIGEARAVDRPIPPPDDVAERAQSARLDLDRGDVEVGVLEPVPLRHDVDGGRG